MDDPGRVAKGVRAEVADGMSDDVRKLISTCWAQNPDRPPSFVEIQAELERIDFGTRANVNTVRVKAFQGHSRRRERQRRPVSDWMNRDEKAHVFERRFHSVSEMGRTASSMSMNAAAQQPANSPSIPETTLEICTLINSHVTILWFDLSGTEENGVLRPVAA
jgi:hypothetical protein